MSEERDQYSSPTSTQGLIIRVLAIGGLIIALAVGIIWYVSK